jgi:branched-chain amino acid transport system permease protein
MLATAYNRLAARLMGINTASCMSSASASPPPSARIAGVLIAPITLTSYDVGMMLGLKGFAAAILGGLGNPSARWSAG